MSIKKLFFIFTFIISICQSSFAYTYCFKQNVSLLQVSKYVKEVLAPRDRVTEISESNCLSISLSADREELARKWIERRYSIISSSNSSSTASLSPGSECRLKVERVLKSNSKVSRVQIGKNSGAQQFDDKNMGKRTTSLLLSSGRSGNIRYNDEFIGVKCIKGGRDNYQVEILVDNNEGGVSTSISISKGQKINIGEIISENKNNSKNISLTHGVGLTGRKKEERFTYFLMID